MNRKISFWLTGAAGVLAAVGLVLLIADVYTCQRYGVHINDVAGIADDGTAIPWPTGEDPFFSRLPILGGAAIFWVAAAGVYALGIGEVCGWRITRQSR